MTRMLLVTTAFLLVACGGNGGGGDEDGTADGETDGAEDVGGEDTAVEDTFAEDVTAEDVAEEDAGGGPLVLDLGEVVEITGEDGLFDVTVEGPAGGGTYAMVVFPTYWVGGRTWSYSAEQVGGGGAAPLPVMSAEVPELAGHPATPDFTRLPGLDWERFAEHLGDGVVPLWEEWPPDDPPVVGEVRSFQLSDASYTVQTIDGECMFVDDEIAIWFDVTTAPATEVSDMDEIAGLYRDIVMPRERIFFGEESDYNEDGVVFVLFSPLVADVATAYFHPCDLLEDPSPASGCSHGNHAEMLYASPPNLLPPMMSSPMALNETMAHESGHMIYFHRKFLMNDQPTAWENIYLNEAIAAMAQDLTGMTGGNFFVVQAGLDEIERFCAFDIMNATGGYIMDRDGALRGGAYLFLRYLYDQNGGDHAESDGTITDTGGVAWLNGWVDGPSLGLANIASSTGMDAEDVIFDFYTTLIVSNRGPDSAPITDDPRFNYLPTQEDPLTTRTRGADMYGSFRDMFSLSGPAYGTIEYNDGQILSTGVQYLLFTADGIADISLTVDAEAEARLRIVRVE